MPDTINEGFGASAPVVLAAATVDILCRHIVAPPDGFVRIRSIDFAVAQVSGAVVAQTVIPIYVLRGNANLGVAAAAGGALNVALRPTGLVLPGLPDVGQLVGGIELLIATYINSRSTRALIFPDDEEFHVDLVARDQQKLIVCVGPLVDVTVAPPVFAAGTSGASLSVLGSQGKLSAKTQIPGILGNTASLPRYDIEDGENRGAREANTQYP